MNELIDAYETTNLTLAATLQCMNVPLSHVTITGRNRTMGCFHFTQVSGTYLMEFDQGTLKVDPAVFHMNLRRLTSMVKGIRENV